MNLLAGVYGGVGLFGNTDFNAAVGGGSAVSNTTGYAQETVETGAPTGSTLFGMYNVLAGGFNELIETVTAGPSMLSQAGVPSFVTGMLTPLFAVVIVIDILSYLRGWGL